MMDERIVRLFNALGKYGMQYRKRSMIKGLNSSEEGIFWAMSQMLLEKPETELFSLSQLNGFLNYTRPNLSQTINKLEDKGFVERVALKEDRRVTYIRLAKQGKETLEKQLQEKVERMKKIETILGTEDTEKLIELSLRFADAYEQTETE